MNSYESLKFFVFRSFLQREAVQGREGVFTDEELKKGDDAAYNRSLSSEILQMRSTDTKEENMHHREHNGLFQ